ncbi:hypothetical protein E1301_Tti019155 [Triplophysa tibetana]|uniref:UPAR/Ly6 domain-containing protein n=1 Tax=Triplophysa tibetana TaxID=1572043 RepID=A0A5A9PF36_9TELE|nr:hypothetical protein E1301_Tti019155 [Triplophysa tibetana]
MDLRITIVLLSVFINGGHCIKCYSCKSLESDVCEETIETCPGSRNTCKSSSEKKDGSSKWSVLVKECVPKEKCMIGIYGGETGLVSVQCCNTDLCNGADGVYKGSFLLLLSPLFFYFLCH